jgi:hypothetical protein
LILIFALSPIIIVAVVIIAVALLSVSDLQRVLDSVADNQAYLSFNMSPVERVLRLLGESFKSTRPTSEEEAQFTLDLSVNRQSGGNNNAKRMMMSSFSSLYSQGYVRCLIFDVVLCSVLYCTVLYCFVSVIRLVIYRLLHSFNTCSRSDDS